jgi:hypothetical protein
VEREREQGQGQGWEAGKGKVLMLIPVFIERHVVLECFCMVGWRCDREGEEWMLGDGYELDGWKATPI